MGQNWTDVSKLISSNFTKTQKLLAHIWTLTLRLMIQPDSNFKALWLYEPELDSDSKDNNS